MSTQKLIRALCLLCAFCAVSYSGLCVQKRYVPATSTGLPAPTSPSGTTFCTSGPGSSIFSASFTNCFAGSGAISSDIQYKAQWLLYNAAGTTLLSSYPTTPTTLYNASASPITVSATTAFGSYLSTAGVYLLKIKLIAQSTPSSPFPCGAVIPTGTGYISAAACTLTVVDPTTTITVTPSTGIYCAGGSGVALACATGSSGASYSWVPPSGGVIIGAGSSVSATAPVSGVFSVTASFSTATGTCSSAATATVYAPASLTVTPLAATPTVCTGHSTTLSPGISGGSDFTGESLLGSASALVTSGLTSVASGGTGLFADSYGANDMDNGFVTIPLGFNFKFYGITYNTINISANGYANFGTPTTYIPSVGLPNTAEPGACVALFAHDMDPGSGGDIGYALTGGSGSHKLTIVYNGVPDAGGTGSNTGQIVIDEASGNINMMVVAGTYIANQGVQNLDGSLGQLAGTWDVSGTGYSATSDEERVFTFNTLPSTVGYAWGIISGPGTYLGAATTDISASPTTDPLTGGTTTNFSLSVTDAYGCPSTGNIAVTADFFNWNGITSNDWNTGSNWDCGSVPTVTDDAIVSNSIFGLYYPVLSAAGATHDLTIGITTFTGVSASVTVGAGQTLQVAGNLYVVENGALNLLTINSGGRVEVAGDATNGGRVTGDGDLVLNGSGTQALKSSRLSGSVSSKLINNLLIEKTTGTVAVDNSSASDTVGIETSLRFGTGATTTLYTNDYLKVFSTALHPSFIGAVPATVSISGTVAIEQHFPGGRRAYRFFAHPFNGNLAGGLQQLLSGVDVTGEGSPSHCFVATASHNASAWRYDPLNGNSTLASDPGWDSFRSACGVNATYSPFVPNDFYRFQGIRLFVRGIPGQGLGYATPYTPTPTTLTMQGSINTGDQNVTLYASTSTCGGTTPCQTYNMVGNPYPSPVNIGAVCDRNYVPGPTSGSLLYSQYVYVWRPYRATTGQFQAIDFHAGTYAGNYTIPPNASVQVRANPSFGGSRVLTFHESDKVSTYASGYLPYDTTAGTGTGGTATGGNALMRGEEDFTVLNIVGPEGNLWDELKLQFNDAATANEDPQFDAGKLMGFDYNFYSLGTDGQPLTYDFRPFTEGEIIPIGMNGTEKVKLSIQVPTVAIPAGKALYLHDKKDGSYNLIKVGMEYPFEFSGNASVDGARFELAMKQGPLSDANGIDKLAANLLPNPAFNIVDVTFSATKSGNTTIKIMDVTGVAVQTYDAGNTLSGTVTFNISGLAAGVYMVEVASGTNKVVQRLIKE